MTARGRPGGARQSSTRRSVSPRRSRRLESSWWHPRWAVRSGRAPSASSLRPRATARRAQAVQENYENPETGAKHSPRFRGSCSGCSEAPRRLPGLRYVRHRIGFRTGPKGVRPESDRLQAHRSPLRCIGNSFHLYRCIVSRATGKPAPAQQSSYFGTPAILQATCKSNGSATVMSGSPHDAVRGAGRAIPPPPGSAAAGPIARPAPQPAP